MNLTKMWFLERAAAVWSWLQLQGTALFDRVEQWRLITPVVATSLVLLVIVCIALPVVHLWLHHSGARKRTVVVASLGVVVATAVLLQVPTGFAGGPDDNCTKYDEGKLTFTYLAAAVVPAADEKSDGHGWLVLIVKAPERWGHDTHQCRLSLDDEKVMLLLKVIKIIRENAARNPDPSEGLFTFTFGGRNEVPNVKAPPAVPPGNVSPPEVAPSQIQGA